MKDIIIYGAGKTGIEYATTLIRAGKNFAGFCDTYKTGTVSVCGKKFEILNIESIRGGS